MTREPSGRRTGACVGLVAGNGPSCRLTSGATQQRLCLQEGAFPTRLSAAQSRRCQGQRRDMLCPLTPSSLLMRQPGP